MGLRGRSLPATDVVPDEHGDDQIKGAIAKGKSCGIGSLHTDAAPIPGETVPGQSHHLRVVVGRREVPPREALQQRLGLRSSSAPQFEDLRVLGWTGERHDPGDEDPAGQPTPGAGLEEPLFQPTHLQGESLGNWTTPYALLG